MEFTSRYPETRAFLTLVRAVAQLGSNYKPDASEPDAQPEGP